MIWVILLDMMRLHSRQIFIHLALQPPRWRAGGFYPRPELLAGTRPEFLLVLQAHTHVVELPAELIGKATERAITVAALRPESENMRLLAV